MNYLKVFENFNSTGTLIIVDVQKSFRKYFSEMYLHELKKYCKEFENVYQIFDNHVDGKNPNLDYLYKENPEVPIHQDLYHFPNQKDIIEKRYNYDVDADFYKKILDKSTYQEIKTLEEKNSLQRGQYFSTKEGTIIVYIGNKHRWFHVPKKLYELFIGLKEAQSEENAQITIVGGADSECLTDIIISAESLGLNIKRNWKFIYTASSCPIK
jgi:hypothetical protein